METARDERLDKEPQSYNILIRALRGPTRIISQVSQVSIHNIKISCHNFKDFLNQSHKIEKSDTDPSRVFRDIIDMGLYPA